MCSRYELNATPREIARRFCLPEEPEDLPRPVVRPTDLAPVIAPGAAGAPHARAMRFGLDVSWSERPLLHARAETVARKPTFRPFLGRRCLVPASGYFEWRADGRRRLKNRIAFASGRIMAFAGLHDGTRFMIVTCAPAPAIAHIHDRMPVVLPESAEATWLDSQKPFADVASLLVPYGADAISFEEEEPPPPSQADLFGG